MYKIEWRFEAFAERQDFSIMFVAFAQSELVIAVIEDLCD